MKSFEFLRKIPITNGRKRLYKKVTNLQFLLAEAQLGLLLGGGNILFCKGLGGGLRGAPPLSKIFTKQKCFFKGLKSKKRKF